MKITFVGAGNLASHLAPALAQAGHEIVCVCSRTLQSATALAERVGLKSAVTTDLQQIQVADAYVISVKDDAIPEIVEAWPERCREGVVMHTSGTTDIDELKSAGEHVGVLYPMQTFSKNKTMDFKKIPCFIESNDSYALSVIKTMAESVSGNVSELTSSDRRFLHIAAVFACNFSNHLYAIAYELMEQHGIAPECLIPLIDETAEKVHHLHPHEGQTGPARRADKNILTKHLEALQSQPELREIYKMMTDSIRKRFQ